MSGVQTLTRGGQGNPTGRGPRKEKKKKGKKEGAEQQEEEATGRVFCLVFFGLGIVECCNPERQRQAICPPPLPFIFSFLLTLLYCYA